MYCLRSQCVLPAVGSARHKQPRRSWTISHSAAASSWSNDMPDKSELVSMADPVEPGKKLVEEARESVLSDEESTQYLADLCGYYELSDAQRCVLQELEQSMTRASNIFWVVGFSIIVGAGVEQLTSGTLTSLATNIANLIHYVALALLTATASRSFHRAALSGRHSTATDSPSAAAEAKSRGGTNALPSVMMAITRLSTVLSQFSSMALATMVITVIAATSIWPPLQLFTGFAVATVMLVRAVAGMMLVTDGGSTHSIVSAAVALQNNNPIKNWRERFAVTVAASNVMHYPFLTAFNQARAQRVRDINAQRLKTPEAANGVASVGFGVTTPAGTAPAPTAGEMPAAGNLDRRGLAENREYEFNQSEQLMLQVMTDEVRMSGYNHVYLSLAVVLFFAAHIGTGTWLQAILNLLQLNDTMGTAVVMFMVAKHFETAVVTSGNDITSLMRGLGSTSGLTKLFTRIGNLAKGVIIGQIISIIWNGYPHAAKAITSIVRHLLKVLPIG